MATVTPSHHHEHQPQPQPPSIPSSEALPADNSNNINGAAIQHNSVDTFPPSSFRPAEVAPASEVVPPQKPAISSQPLEPERSPATPISYPAPPSNVESGLAPTAPFLEVALSDPIPPIPTTEIPPPAVAAAGSLEGPADASMEVEPSLQHRTEEATVETTPQTAAADPQPKAETAEPAPAQVDLDMDSPRELVPESSANAVPEPTPNGVSTGAAPAPQIASADVEMTDSPPSNTKVSREREEEDDDQEPSAKRAKTETETETEEPITKTEAPIAGSEITDGQSSAPVAAASAPAAAVSTPVADGSAPAVPPPQPLAENWGPMTDFQTRQLKQNIQNLKKGRHAISFSKPVDPVALNIPTYFDIVKEPMDLSTLEQKLKDGKYPSVTDFIKDFNLIVDNCVKFNGPNHAISIAAQSLNAQFVAGLRKIPKAGEAAPPPQPKKRAPSFALPARDTKTRGARPSGGAASSPTSASNQTFALANNGVPLVRRTSTTDGRPKREIKLPPPRDLPYSAKPKKKKFQMELKFCEHVLSELKKGRYAALMVPFSHPVDPVALNIPNYHKVVKKPMDFSTVTEKLNSGQYENAKEFEADVHLIFDNCLKFNGAQHPISGLAKQFDDIFTAEMSHKTSWINHNAPASAPQSPEADSESEQEEDDAEEEDDVDEKAEALRKIQQQIAELSATAMALATGTTSKTPKGANKKSAKAAKPGKPNKKTTAASRPDKKAPKPKAKPSKPLTNKEKEEIAERIGELNVEQTAKAAEQIKAGLRRIGRPELADRPDDELEFDISIIPEDTLQYLHRLIRSMDAPTDYRPTSAATQSRHAHPPPRAKKNKPMGKHEQEAAIRQLEGKIQSFGAPPRAGESSGANDDDDDDDDDDESGSESEEE